MVGGIGVLGWGVGGLEAESVMLGAPVMLRVPEVVGVRLFGRLREGVTATDLRSEEHTSELQSLMRISSAVFCLKKKKHTTQAKSTTTSPKQILSTAAI